MYALFFLMSSHLSVLDILEFYNVAEFCNIPEFFVTNFTICQNSAIYTNLFIGSFFNDSVLKVAEFQKYTIFSKFCLSVFNSDFVLHDSTS